MPHDMPWKGPIRASEVPLMRPSAEAACESAATILTHYPERTDAALRVLRGGQPTVAEICEQRLTAARRRRGGR